MPAMSIQQAAVTAFRTYLEARATALGLTWDVRDRWPMDEQLADNTIAIVKAGPPERIRSQPTHLSTTIPELLEDGDMEAVGTADWTEFPDAVACGLSKTSVAPWEGTQDLKVESLTGTATIAATQAVLTPGTAYRVEGRAKGDGTHAPSVWAGSTLLWTGSTSTDWQAFRVTGEATDPSGTEIRFGGASVALGGSVQFDSCTVTGVLAVHKWRLWAVNQPVQINTWNTYPAKRDELIAILDAELNRGYGTTLSESNADPFRDGVLIELDSANGHEGNVDVVVIDGFGENDDADASRRAEFRSSARADLRTELVLSATSPRILELILQTRIGEGPMGTGPTETYTLDASS